MKKPKRETVYDQMKELKESLIKFAAGNIMTLVDKIRAMKLWQGYIA
jgi:hypothetical protein